MFVLVRFIGKVFNPIDSCMSEVCISLCFKRDFALPFLNKNSFHVGFKCLLFNNYLTNKLTQTINSNVCCQHVWKISNFFQLKMFNKILRTIQNSDKL